jgi:uncharacterized repeat protein (TIGR01451 family)
MILGSLLVLTGAAAAESSAVPAWPTNIPWQNYTIAGEPVRDYEDKPYENDPTHGIANVQPKEVDIASGVDASGGGAANNPGNFTSVQWYYWDQLSDSSGFTNLDDDWLFLRMRVADDPRHGGKFYFSSYHWDILIDTDGDIWKEFVVDISGGGGAYKFGTVGVYYNDNETYKYEPDDDDIWVAEASTASNDYTRALAIDYGPNYNAITQYWIEYRIPVTSFKDKSGNPQLSEDTPFRLFFSTSASMTNPLQKDWMAEYVFATPPNITVAKSVEEAYVDPSDVIHYTIYYNNTGESNAGVSYINDTLSEYVTYHSSSLSFSSKSGNIYTWKFDTVAPGNHTLYLNVTANKYIISGTEIINYVHFDYTDESGTPFPDSEDSVKSIVTAPAFELEKLVLESEAYPGDTLHYELHFTNTAAGSAKEVWVNDTIPTGTTFKEASPMYYSMTNNKIVWYFENFVPGKKIIYLNVTAGNTLADGLVLNNSVELLFNDANGNLYPKLYSWSETKIIKPHISVEKSADRSTADPGDIVEYTFKLTNDGLGTASYVWINDTVPDYMTYASASPAYTKYSGNIISWYLTDITPGVHLISLELQVDVGTPDATILKNDVTVNYWAGPDLPYPEEVDTEEVTVTAPIMSIKKVADVISADPSDIITYTITYKNTGNGTAGIVWVNDTTPAHTTYVSSTPKYTTISGNIYGWKFIDVEPGTYTITLKVQVNINTPDGTTLNNNVSLDYTDANGNQPYPTQYDDTTVTSTAPIITISKEADVTVADPGDIITYTIEYENTGTGNAAHVWINDTIPGDTSYVSSNPAYTSVSVDTYTWHFTDVKPGSYKITLEVRVDIGTKDGIELENTVTLEYTDANGNPYQSQSDSVTVIVTSPILSISKVADTATADPSDIITYNITYINKGTGVSGHVWINDTIPAETTYVSSTPNYTSVSVDTYTWHFTDVPTGTYWIILQVRVDVGTPDGTTLINNVTLDYTDANGNQPYPSQDDSATVVVTAPIMTVEKISNVSTADPGDIITYTITYKNLGTGMVGEVIIKDTIPVNTTYSSSTPAYSSVSGDIFTWKFTNVSTGTYYILLNVKVDSGVPDETILVNKVTLDYTDLNSNPYTQKVDYANVTLTAPIMTISKVADVPTADPSDIITYTIEYKNTGTGVAGYVWVNDTIPSDTVHVSSSPTHTSESGNTYTWLFKNVTTGTYSITLKVRVIVGTADETPLINSVTLDYTDANGNQPYAQQSDTARVIVTAPIMTIDKYADVSTADPDDNITYTIKYENSGTGVAGYVWINDTIAPNTTYVSSNPAYNSVSGDKFTWKFTDVKTGVYYITLKVKVDVSTPDKTLLVNSVTLDYTDTNSNPYTQENANAKVIVTSPIMNIIKDSDVNNANPGDIVTYKIYYSNIGTGNASIVYINDTIPSETVFVSSTPAHTSNIGNMYSWKFTDVSTGNYTITMKLRVKTGTPDEVRVVNFVAMEYSDANDNFYPAMNDTATITITAPEMIVSKVADVSTADPGGIITYTITYKNEGTGAAGNVWINDTIPTDSAYVSSSANYTSVVGNTYIWLFKIVKTGTYTLTLKVRVRTGVPDKAVITNNVSLDYTDANGGQPYKTQYDRTDVTITAPVMSITKTAKETTADPGDTITYNITYGNIGTGIAGSVWINDTIPSNTIYVSSSPVYTSVSGNIYTWLFKDVGTGTYSIELVVRVKAGTDDKTILTNNVSLDYTDANGGQPYKTQYDIANVTVTAPMMDIQKEVSGVSLNSYVITDFRLRIAGEKWHNVVLSIYDGNTTVANASITRYPGDPDEQAVTIYDVKVNPVSDSFYAIIEYTPLDDPVNGQIWGANPCWLTLIFEDDSSVRLKHTFNVRHNDTWVWRIDDFEPYTAKAPTTYEVLTTFNITYNNTGTGVAGHVWINDTIPNGTTFISCSPNATSVKGNTYTWHFTDIAPGSYYISITLGKLITKNDNSTNITIENDVSLDYTDINGNQPYPTKHAHAEIIVAIPLMKISKTVNPNSGKYGDYLSVTIRMNNNLANATMIEYLPIELAYTGNGIDDDGDGFIDEEAKDGIDNDGDGKVDEDLGNFMYDGKPISSGLNYTGNNLTFYPVEKGFHTITFDITIVEKTLIKHVTTNLVHLVFGNYIIGKDTADITLHVYNKAPTTIISHPENNSQHFEDIPITFNSDDSYDDGSNVSYYWDFGDGNTSTEKNPTHTYSEPGIYNVTLTITDSASNSTTSKIQLIIHRSIPEARILKPSKREFLVGQNITFKGKAWYHGNYSSLNFSWNLGDGTILYGKSFIHSYHKVGNYTVTLTVTDPDGDFSTAIITLIIVNASDDDDSEKPDKPEHPDHPEHPEKPDKPKQNNKYKAKNQPAEPARKPEAPLNNLPNFDNIEPNVPAVENSNSPNGANAAVASAGFVAKNYQMMTNGSSSKKKDKDNPETSSNSPDNDDDEDNNDNNDEGPTGE